MTTFGSRFLIASLFISLAAANTMAGIGDKGTRKAATPDAAQTNDDYRAFLINNIFNYYSNNGDGSYNKFTQNGAFEYPKGTWKTAVFEDGIVWGGFHKGRAIPKVGGSVYRHGLQAGRILTPGGPTEADSALADDPAKTEYRIYRVRPDITPKTTFAAVQAMIDSEEVRYLSRIEQAITTQQVYDQYIADWNQWPAANGAPFQDVDGNGVYDPAVDIPGVPGADQTLWYVANDMNATRVSNLSGSPPIGIEMQRTFWGYKRSGEFGNVIFQRTLLINKSGAPIDSMYITQWSDSDLGDAGDDLVGCDTTLSLGYTYNGRETDATYGTAVPAVGYMLLQGPKTPDTAVDTAWVDGHALPGFHNIGMATFFMFTGGYASMADPPSGYGGDVEWYRLMRGMPIHQDTMLTDPTTGRRTPILYPGDPVTGQRWIDGVTLRPGDRRMLIASGPFTMANGDTQSILVANMIGQGQSRLSSVRALKETARHIRALYEVQHATAVLGATVLIAFPDPAHATISVTADSRGGPTPIAADLSTLAGTGVADVPLFDDGTHGDQHAGDHIYAGQSTIPRQHDALFLNASVRANDGSVVRIEHLVSNLTTAVPVELSLQRIFADNLNNDLRANPYELVRFGVTIRNSTAFDFANVAVRFNGRNHVIPSFPSGAIDSMHYNAVDPTSYFEGQIIGIEGSTVAIPIVADDPSGNVWSGDILFSVEPLPFGPEREDTVIHHVQGPSSMFFNLNVLDPTQLHNHLYTITGVDSINAAGDPGLTLKDSTDGRVLFQNHPLPDPDGYTVPVTDGFKLLTPGFLNPVWGTMHDWQTVHGTRPWAWTNAIGTDRPFVLEGFSGTIGNAWQHWPSGGTSPKRMRDVLIRFAATDSSGNILSVLDDNGSVGYRYLDHANQPPARPEVAPFIKNPSAGFAYQDFTRGVPFAAYDVTVNPPVRLAVGFLENNVPSGSVDGKYWPPYYLNGQNNTDSTSPREWFFIFDMPYSQTPSPILETDIWNTHVPMMWVGYPLRRNTGPFSANGIQDQFLISAYMPPSSADLWVFQLQRGHYIPETYALLQNFPNPFNPGTQIRYRLPEPSRVVVKVYDLLGREVRTLVDNTTYAGEFTVLWDGTDNRNQRVASGVYFCRIQAEGVQTKAVYGDVKKMLLLR